MKKELEKYFVIADTVQEANGDTCEVILYELTKSGSYVAYVANGTVTGQKTGGSQVIISTAPRSGWRCDRDALYQHGYYHASECKYYVDELSENRPGGRKKSGNRRT